MIKNILLDLDNTILDFNAYERAALKKTLHYIGAESTDAMLIRFSEINLLQWKLLEKGEITLPELKVRRYKLFLEEQGIAASPASAAKYYESVLGEGCHFISGAQELLEELSESYRLYIVSNGITAVQTRRIVGADIGKYMSGIFLSQEVGAVKPDVRFFEYCFKRIDNFKREETVIVGDSLSSDIKGGKNAGIKTVWFNEKNMNAPTDTTPDYEFNKLSELPAIIKSI